MPLSLTDLSAGHVFEPIAFAVDARASRAYVDAVQDSIPLYEAEGLVPPLALAALALGALLNQVGLPPGSLHASESVECLKPVAVGATVHCSARLAQRSQRAGWIVSVLDSELSVDGAPCLTARASVLSPASPS